MTEKDLKKLNRRELLEMLLFQTKRADRLQAELEEAEAKLREKESAITDAGELNDTVLKLSGVFESAKKAADEYIAQGKSYLQDAETRREGILRDADEEAGRRIRNADAEAERIRADAEAEAKKLMDETNDCCVRLLGQTADEMEKSLSVLRPAMREEKKDGAEPDAPAGEKKPAEEKPAEEKPAKEKPVNKKPAAKKPGGRTPDAGKTDFEEIAPKPWEDIIRMQERFKAEESAGKRRNPFGKRRSAGTDDAGDGQVKPE